MNIVIIPFHDWRKSEYEGFRTRDVHFIKAFEKLDSVKNILVINRPYTYLELKIKRYKSNLDGDVIFKSSQFKLTKVSAKINVLDFQSSDFFNQIVYKHKWFMNMYAEKKFLDIIHNSFVRLKFKNPLIISQNIFAYKLLINLKSDKKIFDAWDNFMKFPSYNYMSSDLKKAYEITGNTINIWLTNSTENQNYFKQKFNAKKIYLVKNGVNLNFKYSLDDIPKDISDIPRPIIGFGGKISYLLDTELINYLSEQNPHLNFVFVGQILDKKIYKQIKKATNVYFLGDKKYDVYPKYVNAFDIAFIPYKIKENQHGGDSLKAYEFLQAQKKVVGTRGNGLEDLESYLYIADSKKEFSNLLNQNLEIKNSFPASKFSWKSKAEFVLSIFS